MADIAASKSVSIKSLMGNLSLYQYNPSAIQRLILDYLSEVTSGTVDVVDPTNPFVFLLESSAVNTALAINENIANLRKLYPALAQTEDDLYLHMSDVDFIDRFAVPAPTTFTVAILKNSLLTYMVALNPKDKNSIKKATIARNSYFNVDGLTFSMQYPIDITLFPNSAVGGSSYVQGTGYSTDGIHWDAAGSVSYNDYQNSHIQISYDATSLSPLQSLATNIIPFTIRTDSTGADWVFFNIDVNQFTVTTSYYHLQASSVFSQTIPYADQYYYCRVWYRNNTTIANGKPSDWVEMLTTHTDQVFNPDVPTAVLQVVTGNLVVFIPTVYMTLGIISGDIRVDIYTTKGDITADLSNYNMAGFSMTLFAIDQTPGIDINDYTNAFSNVTYYSFNSNLVSGGANGIDFTTLKNQVIMNSIGTRVLPITNAQITSYLTDLGFDLIMNIDAITNRIFLATRVMPQPTNPKLLTSANIGISPIIVDIDSLVTLPNVLSNANKKRITILSNNLYTNTNGVINILNANQVSLLNNKTIVDKVAAINDSSTQYLYSPYYYVIDNTEIELEIRAYDLDYPKATGLSFRSQNASLQLAVNTASYTLNKTSEGYTLIVVTSSSSFYQQLNPSEVTAQLAFQAYPSNGIYSYIDVALVTVNSNKERVFTFNILTTKLDSNGNKVGWDIDNNDILYITNSYIGTNAMGTVGVPLTTQFHILYSTNSETKGYIPETNPEISISSTLQNRNPAFLLITHEIVNLTFGYSLNRLWVRNRTYQAGSYPVYTQDVYLTYNEDTYDTDPGTGSVFTVQGCKMVYTPFHKKGETVVDANGNKVILHKQGDPILTAEVIGIKIEFDMLFVDGKYYFATDAAFVAYKKELVEVLDTWMLTDLAAVQESLLEQTKIYFYAKTSLNTVNVTVGSDIAATIPAQQSIVVKLYVVNAVYNDATLKASLQTSTISLLNNMLVAPAVSTSSIIKALLALYGTNVESVSISGLGGPTNNYDYVTMTDSHNKLCLNKILKLQDDGTTIVTEDVIFIWYSTDVPL